MGRTNGSPFTGLAMTAMAVLMLAAGCTASADVGVSGTETSEAGEPAEPTLSDTASDAPDPDLPETTPVLPDPPTLRGNLEFEIVSEIPHPTVESFTQGLEFVDDRLLEGTGRRGESDRRWVDPETGDVLASAGLEEDLFGEGLTEVDGLIYQLTWTSERLLIADAETLEQVDERSYEGEGWGLCHNGDRFVMSNGLPSLTIRETETFDIVETVPVTMNNEPLGQLNELECVGTQVWANIWLSNVIVAIDPETGMVEATLDLAELTPAPDDLVDGDAVLNGIAYRVETDTFFVTGKNWPVMYELRLTEP